MLVFSDVTSSRLSELLDSAQLDSTDEDESIATSEACCHVTTGGHIDTFPERGITAQLWLKAVLEDGIGVALIRTVEEHSLRPGDGVVLCSVGKSVTVFVEWNCLGCGQQVLPCKQ